MLLSDRHARLSKLWSLSGCSVQYLEGQGDIASSLITPISHIVTLYNYPQY